MFLHLLKPVNKYKELYHRIEKIINNVVDMDMISMSTSLPYFEKDRIESILLSCVEFTSKKLTYHREKF